MRSSASDVSAYLNEVPAERQAAMARRRALCRTRLKGFEESIQYGGPCYSRNGVVEAGSKRASWNRRCCASVKISISICASSTRSAAMLVTAVATIGHRDTRSNTRWSRQRERDSGVRAAAQR